MERVIDPDFLFRPSQYIKRFNIRPGDKGYLFCRKSGREHGYMLERQIANLRRVFEAAGGIVVGVLAYTGSGSGSDQLWRIAVAASEAKKAGAKYIVAECVNRLVRHEMYHSDDRPRLQAMAVAQQLDFSGTTGQLVASVLFAIAQMERENLRENTKRGLEAAKARGVKLGKRPGKWTAEVKALHDEGVSVSEIAERFGKSRQGVWNVLRGKTATYRNG